MTFIPPARRGNPWAIASIILGVFACIPFITSGLAVIFGFIGLARARNDGLRPAAVIGIILGVIGIIFWGGVTGAAVSIFRGGGFLREDVGMFVDNLQKGNISAAKSYADASISDEQLRVWALQLQPMGKLQSVSVNNTNVNLFNGVGTATLTGTLNFANGSIPFTANLRRSRGEFLITNLTVKGATSRPMNVTWSHIIPSYFAAAA